MSRGGAGHRSANRVVRFAFSVDAFDRQSIIISGVANAGISGSDVRDMMLDARNFHATKAPQTIEHLSDNGSADTTLRNIDGWIEDYNDVHSHQVAYRGPSPPKWVDMGAYTPSVEGREGRNSTSFSRMPALNPST